MKIRRGFVSNSSSSSFIIGFGEVKDMELLKNYMKEHNIEFGYYFKVLTKSDIGERWHIGEIKDNNLIIYGGNKTSLNMNLGDMDPIKNYLVVEITNDEGDGEFYIGEDFDDLNYEKAEQKSFYSDEQQKIIELFNNKKIIKKGKVIFGAERNG